MINWMLVFLYIINNYFRAYHKFVCATDLAIIEWLLKAQSQILDQAYIQQYSIIPDSVW